MDKELAELITDISLYSVLIPVLVAVVRFKYLNALQRLVALLVFTTLIGELGVYQLSFIINNNLPAIHIFTVLQFALIVLIFERGLVPTYSKYFFRILIVGFTIFAILDAFWLNGIYNFNNYSRPLASILLLFLALSYFYKTLKELKIKHLEREPLFWLSVGVIIYFSGSLFIFLFTNYVKTSNEALLTIWGIHAIFNIILNITYAIALWIKPAN